MKTKPEKRKPWKEKPEKRKPWKEKPGKTKPERKLPKKSQRAKRRYIMFSLKQGSCNNSNKAFGLVMGIFSIQEKKELGIWFIEFNPETGIGIVRCRLSGLEKAKKAFALIPAKFQAKTVKISGTLSKLRAK